MAVKMAKKDDQEQRQAEKTEISLTFTPEGGRHLHPQAYEKIQLLFNVFSRYFSSEEWLKPLGFYVANIDDKGLLWVSTDLAQAAQPFYDLDLQNNDSHLTLLLCQLDLDISNIKLKWTDFMQKAIVPYYAEVFRQTKEAEEEAKKAEKKQAKELKEKRIDEAYDTLGRPFLADAKHYLPEEFDVFEESLEKAVDFHIKKDGKYNWSDLPYRYRSQVELIYHLKAKEQQQIQIRNDAQAQATAFGHTLVQGLNEIEKKLIPTKEDPKLFFERYCSDNDEKRYLGEPFRDILDPEWMQGYIEPAKNRLQQFIPVELRGFFLLEPTRDFFLLPKAHFTNYGVPCLAIYFHVFAVVTITVLAQAGKKVFNGYGFDFLTNLREPKLLGFYQITITPKEPRFWEFVPLSILYGLMEGNIEPSGTTLLDRTDQLTVYEIKKFQDDICEIPISLERFFRRLGSIEKLKEATIIDGRTAEVLELHKKVDDKGSKLSKKKSKLSKKDQLNRLFDEGKKPSAAEVKNLGIKPNTVYRYYQAWKKAHNI